MLVKTTVLHSSSPDTMMKYTLKNIDSESTLSTLASSARASPSSEDGDSVGELSNLSEQSNHNIYMNTPKSVSFGKGKKVLELVREVECLANAPEGKACMWYQGKELSEMRKKDIKTLRKVQAIAAFSDPNASIESDEVTWRGFEDIQGNWCRVEKSSKYTRAVVEHYHHQLENGYFDDDEIRTIARGLSKQERNRARGMALLDAKDIGMSVKRTTIRKSQSNVTTSSTSRSSSLKKSSSSGSANNLKMMKKSLSYGGGVSSMQSLRKGLKSVRKSVKGNFQWSSSSSKSKTATTSSAAGFSLLKGAI